MAMSYAFVWDDHGVIENKAVDPGRLTDGVSIGLLATVFRMSGWSRRSKRLG
jgi:hypothetical protein